MWDARSGRHLLTPRVAGHATTIAFSADGRLLAAGTEDGEVVLWNAADGSPSGPPIQVANGAIDPISFSPDGRFFGASSADGTSTLWDLRRPQAPGEHLLERAGLGPRRPVHAAR